MHAIILSAGRGERLRPLTDDTPKPLMSVGNTTLIERHITALAKAGFRQIVINVHWLAHKIMNYLGDGSSYGIDIIYSRESEMLGSGGGIKQALPYLTTTPFFVVNADIWIQEDFGFVAHHLQNCQENSQQLGHLFLVDNPPHNPSGDFLLHDGLVHDGKQNGLRHTFSGMSILSPQLFALSAADNTQFSLASLLRQAMTTQQISGQLLRMRWLDVGTKERLDLCRSWMQSDS